MSKDNSRIPLRERVAMRKRGIDPDKPRRQTPSQRRLKLFGLVLQSITVFLLLGYIVYYVQGDQVPLHVEFLVIASAIFIVGRVLTFMGGDRGFKL